MYLSQYQHFDYMALSRIKTAIAYAAREKIVTSVRLYTAGININFLVYDALIGTTVHTTSKMQTLQRHSPHSHLGFQIAKDDGLRGTTRAEVGV